jgi:general secretion pathway protein J
MTPPTRRSAGFTLVEVLVALMAMALMAGLGWRGIDGLLRAREASQTRVDQMAVMHTALSQWQSDLDAMAGPTTTTGVSSLDWDGRVLRILRRASVPQLDGSDAGLWVVSWTVRTLTPDETEHLGLPRQHPPAGWVRTQSPAAHDRATLLRYWSEALQGGSLGPSAVANARGQTPGITSSTVLLPAANWQLFYYRGDAWSNPLSSSGVTQPAQDAALPDGVRLLLTLPPSTQPSGTLTLDWVRPTYSAVRS